MKLCDFFTHPYGYLTDRLTSVFTFLPFSKEPVLCPFSPIRFLVSCYSPLSSSSFLRRPSFANSLFIRPLVLHYLHLCFPISFCPSDGLILSSVVHATSTDMEIGASRKRGDVTLFFLALGYLTQYALF